MVDLIPPSTREIVTSEAPQSRISGSEVAQPYQELAQALDKSGESLEAVATPLAERAGTQAVTRDADGNIQVEHMPIFGLAGAAYGRAVKVGALAEADGDAKRADIDLRQQFRDDPQGYQAAAQAFKQGQVQKMTQAAGPEVGVALGRTIDQTTTQTYRGLLNEKEKLDLQRADNNISAGMKSASDDALALARQGVEPADPSMQSLLGKYATLLGERTANPRLAYTKDQAAFDYQTFQSDLAANRYLHHIDQTYQGQGFAAAETDAKDILTNTDYKLSDSQRESYYHKAIGEVRANEAIRRQDIGEARSAFNELTMASASGARIDPDQVEQVATAFRAANDPGGASRVYASFARKPLNDDFGRQPIADQANQLNALRGAQAAQQAFSFFTGKGYTPEQSAGIVGNLMHESGMNPSLSGDGGTSAGLAQFHNERLTALRQFAAERGQAPTDFQTQLQFIDSELHGKEGGTLAKLQGAKTPEQAAAAFIDYERPAGWTPENPAGGLGFANRQALARTVFDGKPSDGSGGPAATAWLTANRQRGLDKQLWTDWTATMKDYSEKGIRPNDEAVTQIIDGARATGNAALLEQVGHDMSRIDLAQTQAQQPLGQQAAAISQLSAAGQAGALSPGQAATLKDLQTRYDTITKGLKENPISTIAANFSDKIKAPPPLDFSDPQKLVAGLHANAQIAKFGEQNYQTGPLPILDRSDMADLKGALQGPNAPQVLGAIAQGLKPDEMQPLAAEKDFRESITGMSRSGDPAKMNAAYSFMDTLQKQNPLQFDAQFKDGLKDLRAWQANLSFYPPDTVAKRMLAANDPDQNAARKASDEVAKKALETVTPDNIVSKFSTGFGPFGTGARAPVSTEAGIASGAMKADYDQNYRDGFAATGNATAADNFAMEKLRLKYAVSPTNGNRVMANAPERYYPEVTGSHDWMTKQLDDAVAHATGADATTIDRSGRVRSRPTDGSAAPNTAPHAIVSDDQTERDIANGKPPSYQVILQDQAGRWAAMTGADAKVQRFRFDPSALVAARAATMETRRGLVNTPLDPAALSQQAPM